MKFHLLSNACERAHKSVNGSLKQKILVLDHVESSIEQVGSFMWVTVDLPGPGCSNPD